MTEMNIDEGELEDGELDDDDVGQQSEPPSLVQEGTAEQPENTQNLEGMPVLGEAKAEKKGLKKSGSEESEGDAKHGKKKKKRKKRKKEDKEKKKKKKRTARYVDHDRVQDDYEYAGEPGGAWPPYSRPLPGPYDSPYESDDSLEGQPSSKRRPTRYLDLDNPREHLLDLDAPRSPPGPYDNPYDSPPGPYDSPSDDEYGPPPKLQRMESYGGKNKNLNMDDEYLDPGVLANEKPEMLSRSRDMQHNRKRAEKSRRYFEQRASRREQPGGGRRMQRRPLCKFFMDGKCAKGSDCAFSHDCEPPRKTEVCKFYLHDACVKGLNCLYMHNEYPCRFYHVEDNCPNGDECKLSHEELTDETEAILEKGLEFDIDENGDFTPKKRPSLLGSPPRHLRDQNERLKKIPSLFEIQVFPPAKPGSGGPPNLSPTSNDAQPSSASDAPPIPPPPVSGQMPNGPPIRPGFYGEMRGPMPRMPNVGLLGARPPPGMMRGPRMPPPPGYHPSMFYDDYPLHQEGEEEEADVAYEQDMPYEQDSTVKNEKTEEKVSEKPEASQKETSSQESPAQSPSDDPGKTQADQQEIASHLPPAQRQLFMRILRQQQKEKSQAESADDAAADPAVDASWYSSEDEEENGEKRSHRTPPVKKTMQPEMLKIDTSVPPPMMPGPVLPTPPVVTPQLPPGFPPGFPPELSMQPPPSLNISQMLSAIRQKMSVPPPSGGMMGMPPVPVATPPPVLSKRDPRKASAATSSTPSLDPRQALKTPGQVNHATAVVETKPVVAQPLVLEPIEASLDVTGGIPYMLYPMSGITVVFVLPTHIDPKDPKYNDDPRVQKLANLKTNSKLPERRPSGGTEKRSADPRMQRLGSAGGTNNKPAEPHSPRQSSSFSQPGGGIKPVHKPLDSRIPEISTTSALPKLITAKIAEHNVQRSLSNPTDIGFGQPEFTRKNSMPEALLLPPKVLDSRMMRQVSSGNASSGDDSGPSCSKDSKTPFSHRFDPRFKKKAKLNDTMESSLEEDSPPHKSVIDDPRRRGLEHASPLDSQSEQTENKTPSYDAYNKPPNPSYVPEQARRRGKQEIKDSYIPANAITPAPLLELLGSKPLQTENGEETDDRCVRNVFKTIDPTASPFC